MCVVILASVFQLGIASFASDNVTTGTMGDNIVWSLDNETGALNISGTGEMTNYDIQSNPSPFMNNTAITSITISDGITNIGEYAFPICSASTVVIGKDVTNIGLFAFAYCGNLQTVSILSGLKSIGERAFSNCSSLVSITFPETLETIGDSAFSSCTSLISGNIPNSVTSIEDYAFSGCESLVNLHISENKKYANIEEGTFSFCTGLESVTIPNNIQSVGVEAFSYCDSLETVIFSDSVYSIGTSAFRYCSKLKDVTFGKNLTTIGASAFNLCPALTTVTLPNSLSSIGADAFAESGMKIVLIPKHVSSIESNALLGCEQILGYTGSASVTYAAVYSINFEFLDEGHVAGDVNDDGVFDLNDYGASKFAAVEGIEVNHSDFYKFDFNNDGAIDGFDTFEAEKALNGFSVLT